MKVLMIGMGGIGQRHVRNLRFLLGNTVDILAYRVREQSPVLTDTLEVEPGEGLEEKYRIRVFRQIEMALAQKPDIAFVCNPSSMHLATALAAAQAGCHLFIEKPLSHDLDGIDVLIDVVERKGLIALVAYQLRFHPGLGRVRELLQQQSIGRVVAVRAEVGEYLPGWHGYEDYRQMYASRRDQGGGVVLSQIHELDYLYWLFGMPTRLFAIGGHLSRLEIDVEDTASILMDCAGVPVHLQQDYIQRPPSRTLQIVGDAGKILADLRTPRVQLFDGRGTLVEDATFKGFARNQMFLDELKHFLECLAGKCAPVVSLREGAISLRLALAAKESLATGQVIVLK